MQRKTQRENRKLAAIVAADVAEFSRLVRRDEEGTLRALRGHRAELIDPLITEHGGRIANTAGDSVLMEFASAVDAVRCAVALQEAMPDRNADERHEGGAEDRQIRFRIGINLGDVVAQDGDLLGDGVNIAARLEGLAPPGGICLAGNVYEQVRDRLDLLLEDLGEREVKNIARPVRVWQWTPSPAAAPAETTDAPGTLSATLSGTHSENLSETPPDKPAIVVLPFANMSGDSEQEFFADGLTEDIITALSRFHSFDVIGRNTAFTYKGRAVDLKTVSKDLGAQYILEGSVRKAGNRVRITAQLIDGLADSHIWAERYDRELDDIFQVQDEIIEIIVATLAAKVDTEETERRVRAGEANRDAYDCYLTGREYFFARNRSDHQKSLALMDRAIALDGNFAHAHGFKAWLKAYEYRYGWRDDPELSLDIALKEALKALSLDASDYDGHWRLAVVYLHRRQFDKAEAEYQKARALNPNHAGFLAEMSGAYVLMGRFEAAIALLEQAKHINPQSPEWFDAMLGWAHYHAGQFEQAGAALNALNDPPGVFRIFIAANHARQGNLEQAREEAVQLMALEPEFTLSKLDFLPYKNAEDRARLAEDLAASGIASGIESGIV